MKFIVVQLLFFIYLSVQGQQKQAAVWRYGANNQMDFNLQPVKISLTPPVTGTSNGAAAICDSAGKLLFFANGGRIYDREDNTMVYLDEMFLPQSNYGGLGGNVIVPIQKDPHRYFYFNIRHTGGLAVNRIRGSIYQFVVDMKKRNGLGSLDTAKTKVLIDSVGTQLACALHANGKDTWLIGGKYHSDSLVAMLVQDTGIAKTVFSKIGSPTRVPNIPTASSTVTQGYDSQLKTSPNSELLFIPRRTVEYPYHELYQIDRETGEIYGRICIKDTTHAPPFFLNGFPDGAFSPDSKILYVGTGTRNKSSFNNEGPGTFWQFNLENLDSASIAQSRKYLGILGRRVPPGTPEPFPFSPKMQLAMDGKIYISPGLDFVGSDPWMSIIHCPNRPGAACQLKFREINLSPGRNGAYFPTLNQTFVRNAGIFQLQANKRSLCQGDTLELSAYGAGAEHFTWSVNPALPQGVKVDTLTWQKIPTEGITPGSYTFRCVGTSRCNDVFDKSMVVHVRPNPLKPVITGSPPPWGEAGWGLCTGDSVTLSVPDTSAIYQWSTGQTTASVLHKNISLAGRLAYSLVTENQYGCQSPPSDTVWVTNKAQPPAPKPILQTNPATNTDSGTVALCVGDTLQATATGAETYRWSDGNTKPSRKLTGSGSLVLYGYDTAGCAAKAETALRYTTVASPTPRFVNPDSVLTRETLANRNYCVAGQPGSRFLFAVMGGQIVDSSENCVTVQWVVDSRQWTVFATERFSNPPCTGSANQRFTYQPNLSVPNLITPNGDGLNDAFVIQDLEFYPSHHLQIFNRWGKKVLDTQNYRQDWTGEAGMYFYRLNLESRNFTGWVEVVK